MVESFSQPEVRWFTRTYVFGPGTLAIAPPATVMMLSGPASGPSPQLKPPSAATICLRSGEKTGGLQAIWLMHWVPAGATCVICAGAAPLMLAQICGVPLPSNWVQARAYGGADGGVACALVAVGVMPWPRAVDALLLQPASSASDASSASTASSQGMRDEVRMMGPPWCPPRRLAWRGRAVARTGRVAPSTG